MTIPLWACGWWDNEQILIGATNHDLLLYDVRKEATSRLVSFATIAAFLKEHDIHEDPAQSRPFPVWNGREFDFYLTDTHQKWAAEESFLAKLERPDGTLALVSPRFKFQWSDHFDAAGRHYVYSGRETGDASDGVVLRDLESGSNRVLVAGTTNKYHSIPAFYRDSVIYVHSNALWQIGLDGSHNVRLFPP